MNTIRNIRPAMARTRTTSIIVKALWVGLEESFGLVFLLLLLLRLRLSCFIMYVYIMGCVCVKGQK